MTSISSASLQSEGEWNFSFAKLFLMGKHTIIQ